MVHSLQHHSTVHSSFEVSHVMLLIGPKGAVSVVLSCAIAILVLKISY